MFLFEIFKLKLSFSTELFENNKMFIKPNKKLADVYVK